MKLEGKLLWHNRYNQVSQKMVTTGKDKISFWKFPANTLKKSLFSVMNSNIQNFGLAVRQDVDIEIDINANEWQGKWFNSITCWKATLRNPGQPTAAQQPQTYYRGASSTAAPWYKLPYLNRQWILGNKRRFAFLKKGEGSIFGSLLIN